MHNYIMIMGLAKHNKRRYRQPMTLRKIVSSIFVAMCIRHSIRKGRMISTTDITDEKMDNSGPLSPLEKCPIPRSGITANNRAGKQYLTPGHENCTLGWRKAGSTNFGQNLEDAVIYERFFTGGSPLAHLGKENGVHNYSKNELSTPQRGFFVEMGALDGITFTNTLMFEQCLGWNGLLIEANPQNFALLQENRPCAITVGEAACSIEDGPTIRMSGSAGVAFDVEATENENRGDVQEVPCRPLSNILEEHKVTRINFFALDVERAELKVLETLNWDKVQIDVLMVEAEFVLNAQSSEGLDEKIKAVRELVTGKGKMKHVRSRFDHPEDPSTGLPKDLKLCERNGYSDEMNCMMLSIAGSDVFVSPELYEYDTQPWLFPMP